MGKSETLKSFSIPVFDQRETMVRPFPSKRISSRDFIRGPVVKKLN